MGQPDYVDLALRSSRDKFIAICHFPFLAGDARLVKPHLLQRTLGPTDWADLTAATPRAALAGGLTVLAVRKVNDTFPGMITIGRTANHDVVLPDIQVSKFHAYFRLSPGKIELADAGSSNGTWVNAQELPKKGAPALVNSGDTVRFGTLSFRLLDAGACWDRVTGSGDATK